MAALLVLVGADVVVVDWPLVVDEFEDEVDEPDVDDDDEAGPVDAAVLEDLDADAECAAVSEATRIPSPTAAAAETIPIAAVRRRTRVTARLRAKTGDRCERPVGRDCS